MNLFPVSERLVCALQLKRKRRFSLEILIKLLPARQNMGRDVKTNWAKIFSSFWSKEKKAFNWEWPFDIVINDFRLQFKTNPNHSFILFRFYWIWNELLQKNVLSAQRSVNL